MLFALLACAGSPIDTGLTEYPTWGGTQIGEEGDESCPMESAVWKDETAAPPGSDFTPAQLRADAGGGFSGTLHSAWQGDADLSITLTLDGPASALSSKQPHCEPAMSLEGTLLMDAGELLSLEDAVVLIVQNSDASFVVGLEEAQLSGELSPGTLPDDAETLSLLVFADFADSDWSGLMQWWLVRPDGTEWDEAGDWTAESQ